MVALGRDPVGVDVDGFVVPSDGMMALACTAGERDGLRDLAPRARRPGWAGPWPWWPPALGRVRDLGVTFLDTAETYGDGRAEAVCGRALRRLRWPRETIVICTKVFWGVHSGRPGSSGLSRKHVTEGCIASLRRLGVDHLDILLCHRPDPRTPVEETVAAMSDLVRRGLVLYWGTSEWSPELVDCARAVACREGLVAPVAEQLQYNLLRRHRVEVDFAELAQAGLALTTWSPLAYGLLAGRDPIAPDGDPGRLGRPGYEWLRHEALGVDEVATMAAVRRIAAVAGEAGLAPAELALAWTLQNRSVATVVGGASSIAQLEQNVAVAGRPPLDDDLLAAVEMAADVSAPAIGAAPGGVRP